MSLAIARERFERALDRARAAGLAGLRLDYAEHERIHGGYEAGRLKETGGGESSGYTITVLHEGRLGSAAGNSWERFDALLDQARVIAATGAACHFAAYPAPGRYGAVRRAAASTAAISRDELLAACGDIVERLAAVDADLFRCSAGSRAQGRALLMTSGGVCRESESTSWSLSGYVQRTCGTDMLILDDGRAWRERNHYFDPAAIAGQIATDLGFARQTVRPPVGRVRALLSPGMLAQLLQPVLLGLNGRNVFRGESPLAGRLGERVLSERLTLVDDPFVDYAMGARIMDGNGVPVICCDLFRDGVLCRFLYDLDTAGLAGAAPTGHDGCAPNALRVLPGAGGFDELVAAVGDGIYLKGLLGFHTCNHRNGDFSCSIDQGYRIEHGAITGRIKDTMAAGNVFALLGGNLRVGGITNYDGTMPYAVIEGLSLSA